MPQIGIRIEGVDQLVQKLGNVIASDTLQAPLERALQRLKGRLTTYPPERPGQAYQRTGNLGRGWTIKADSGGGTLTNRVSYGPWVQGDKTQASMHRGRWLTDRQAVDQETPAIQQDFADAIDSALQQ